MGWMFEGLPAQYGHSRQNPAHHLPRHIGEPIITARMAVGQLFVIGELDAALQ